MENSIKSKANNTIPITNVRSTANNKDESFALQKSHQNEMRLLKYSLIQIMQMEEVSFKYFNIN